jgi:hypothetical protein
LVAGFHSILARWRKHFFQLLNKHGVNDVRQTEIHTAEPLVPEPSAFEIELATEKLKRHKSPETGQIPTELVKAGGRAYHSKIYKLINSISNKVGYLRNGRSRSLHLLIRRVIKQAVVIIDAYHFYQLRTNFLSNILLSRLTPHAEDIFGYHQYGFRHNRSTTGHIFCIRQILEKKNKNTAKECVSYL